MYVYVSVHICVHVCVYVPHTNLNSWNNFTKFCIHVPCGPGKDCREQIRLLPLEWGGCGNFKIMQNRMIFGSNNEFSRSMILIVLLPMLYVNNFYSFPHRKGSNFMGGYINITVNQPRLQWNPSLWKSLCLILTFSIRLTSKL